MPGTSTPLTVGVRFSSPKLRIDKVVPLTHDELDNNFKLLNGFSYKNFHVDLSDFQVISNSSSQVSFTLFNFDLNLVTYLLSVGVACQFKGYLSLHVSDANGNPLDINVPFSVDITAVDASSVTASLICDYASKYPFNFTIDSGIDTGVGYIDVTFDNANIFRAIQSNNESLSNWIIPRVDPVTLNV